MRGSQYNNLVPYEKNYNYIYQMCIIIYNEYLYKSFISVCVIQKKVCKWQLHGSRLHDIVYQ